MTKTIIGSISDNKNIIFELTRKQIKTQYRNSFLGLVWTILHPLLNMLVMWLVFTSFFGQGDPYYSIYLLCGNILFSSFRMATDQSLQSLVNNRGLLLRTKIDPYVFPVSTSISALVNFFYSMIALIPFMVFLSIKQQINLFSYQALFIFLMIPAFLLFIMGMGLILSVLYVFLRDIKHIYSVILTAWMYLTPVFYKIERFSDPTVVSIIKINPMYHFVTYFRECIYMGVTNVDKETGLISAVLPSFSTLGILYAFGFGFFVIGFVVFSIYKNKVIMRV